MRRRFAVQLRVALWALLAVFIIGLPLLFSQARIPAREEGAQAQARVLARVNGEPVLKSGAERVFEHGIDQSIQYAVATGRPLDMGLLWQLRLGAMEQAIANATLLQQAQSLGVSVSKGDVKQRAQDLVDQQLALFKSQLDGERLEQQLAYVVANTEGQAGRPDDRMSERDFRKWHLSMLTDPAQGLRDQMVLERLEQSVVGQVSVTEDDLLRSYDEAKVRRILVALRPPGGEERTEEEARAQAEELLARVKAGEDFAELAKSESDDPAAQQTGGLLDRVRRGRWPAEWDRAVFSLQPGETTPVVEAPTGYEIVKLEQLARQLPDDFEETKDQLLGRFAQEERNRVWGQYVTDLTDKADIEVVDQEMLAYRALSEGKLEEAIASLTAAVAEVQEAGGLAAASVFYQLATLLASKNEWKEAVEFYAQSSDALSWSRGRGERLPGGRAQALLGMARGYENLGEVEDAVLWYTATSDATEVPSIHSQLRSAFQRLGREELAKREKEWMDRYEQQQREREQALEAERKALEEQQAGPQSLPSPESPAEPERGE
jgi:parvulin-like peptidyl-prolyl isomerase